MKPYLKTVYSEAIQTVDLETGEVIDVQTKDKKILVETREEFVQLYTSVESKLKNLSLSEERLWTYCILHCDKENIIRILSYDKKLIFDKWGLAQSTIANALNKLIETKLIIRVGRGTYRVNPTYAWKGNSNDRRTMLTHVLTIECPTC